MASQLAYNLKKRENGKWHLSGMCFRFIPASAGVPLLPIVIEVTTVITGAWARCCHVVRLIFPLLGFSSMPARKNT